MPLGSDDPGLASMAVGGSSMGGVSSQQAPSPADGALDSGLAGISSEWAAAAIKGRVDAVQWSGTSTTARDGNRRVNGR